MHADIVRFRWAITDRAAYCATPGRCDGNRCHRKSRIRTGAGHVGDKREYFAGDRGRVCHLPDRTNASAVIERALKATGGNRTHAARLLQISHRALLYKLKEYGIRD